MATIELETNINQVLEEVKELESLLLKVKKKIELINNMNIGIISNITQK